MPRTTTASFSPPAVRSNDHSAQRSPARWWRAMWSRRDGKLQEIRRLMTAQLEAVTNADQRALLAEKIAFATETQALWLLRGELLAALVVVHGELLARQRMTDISFMFAGLLECDRRSLDEASEAGAAWPQAHTRALSNH